MPEMQKSWIDQHFSGESDRRAFESERLIQSVVNSLSTALEDSGMSQSQVAARLGKSPAYVSQILSGRRNCTLRTLAEIAWACEHRLEVATAMLQPSISAPDASLLSSGVMSLRRIVYRDRTPRESTGEEQELLEAVEFAA